MIDGQEHPPAKMPIEIDVLFESDEVLVVRKPSGMLVHNNPKYAGDKETSLRQLVGQQLGRRVYPVHRLDRATSGTLLFAKERDVVRQWHERLQQGIKRYVALVRGKSLTAQTLDHPVKTENGARKDAVTRIFPLLSSSTERCSLVGLELQTGRRHQIRQHLKHLSHPIVGDTSYGKGDINRHFRKLGMHRMALHALALVDVFPSPQDSIKTNGHVVSALVPDDLSIAFDLFLPSSWRSVAENFAQKGAFFVEESSQSPSKQEENT
ncbi:MAG: pseudouridylate synthase [Deltaproteobacteria bacterium]|nr:pseudouridylate synthase [Deltaproteobacteria bacterium]